ncbi:MAG: hypothetical protein LBN21_06935 [Treponema sp.]|jgi:uroporphyrinogen-III decarboxylase|nr:hypothetical protein [Treponema sp.]
MPAEKHTFALNAYCSGHITGHDANPDIAAFPHNFVTEALALGAGTEKSTNGFETPQYLFFNPEELLALPLMDEQLPIIRLLEVIEKADPEKTVLLKVNGPYSILASLVSPRLFYRWLAKNKSPVHTALERINAGLISYIRKAVSKGVAILSIADPYANPDILGEKHYCEFAAPYLVELLQHIKAPGLVTHLCPHNSLILAKYGFLKSRAEPAEGESYIKRLIALTRQKDSILLGHQCIYTGEPRELVLLDLL